MSQMFMCNKDRVISCLHLQTVTMSFVTSPFVQPECDKFSRQCHSTATHTVAGGSAQDGSDMAEQPCIFLFCSLYNSLCCKYIYIYYTHFIAIVVIFHLNLFQKKQWRSVLSFMLVYVHAKQRVTRGKKCNLQCETSLQPWWWRAEADSCECCHEGLSFDTPKCLKTFFLLSFINIHQRPRVL